MNTTQMLLMVQIITESLPISSSAHLRLAAAFLNTAQERFFSEGFEHMAHVPSIFIVTGMLVWWYWSAIIGLTKVSKKRLNVFAQYGGHIVLHISYATSVTVVLFYILRATLQALCTMTMGFAITTFLLVLTGIRSWYELRYYHAHGTMPTKSPTVGSSLLLGVGQAAALCPGISRLAATYAIARLCGIAPRRALTYSFLLQLVLLSGGVCRALLFFDGWSVMGDLLSLPVFVASFIAISFLRGLIAICQKRSAWLFAIYTALVVIFMH